VLDIADYLQALAKASESSGKYSTIYCLTYGIAFFGTPHRGTTLVGWTEHITSALRGLCQQPDNTFERSLSSLNEENHKLVSRFEPLLPLYHYISVYVLVFATIMDLADNAIKMQRYTAIYDEVTGRFRNRIGGDEGLFF